MTHFGPVHELTGKLTALTEVFERGCMECKKLTPHTEYVWESHCGGYTDYKYVCNICGTMHWVEGADS
jgi:hypothetical protein